MAMPGAGPVDDGPYTECEECGALIPYDWGGEDLCADCQRERDEEEEGE